MPTRTDQELVLLVYARTHVGVCTNACLAYGNKMTALRSCCIQLFCRFLWTAPRTDRETVQDIWLLATPRPAAAAGLHRPFGVNYPPLPSPASRYRPSGRATPLRLPPASRRLRFCHVSCKCIDLHLRRIAGLSISGVSF